MLIFMAGNCKEFKLLELYSWLQTVPSQCNFSMGMNAITILKLVDFRFVYFPLILERFVALKELAL